MAAESDHSKPTRLTLTEVEAAAYLHERTGLRFSRHIVKRHRLEGRIVGYRLLGKQVYKPADLDAFVTAALTPLEVPSADSPVRPVGPVGPEPLSKSSGGDEPPTPPRPMGKRK